MQYPLVSIISVNYNTAEVTCEMIDSLMDITYPNYEIIIVDNYSHKDPSIITSSYPDIKYIQSEKNVGFAGGNNLGLSKATGDYILFLNNDTTVEPDFLQPLVKVMQEDSTIGLVSPKVIYHETNILQYAGASEFNKYTGRVFTLNYQEEDIGQADETKETNFSMGAAMMTTKEIMKKVGLMPEVFFIYYEEIDWSTKFRKNGYKVYYVADSKIYHKDSYTVGRDSAAIVYYQNRGRIIYLRRNSTFFQKIISYLFIFFLTIPKQVLTFAFKGRPWHVIVFLRAIIWNLINYNIQQDPKLVLNKDRDNEILDQYHGSTQANFKLD